MYQLMLMLMQMQLVADRCVSSLSALLHRSSKTPSHFVFECSGFRAGASDFLCPKVQRLLFFKLRCGFATHWSPLLEEVFPPEEVLCRIKIFSLGR